ncbi:unnamed protein product, partial [marine sediment metagenome]
MSQKKTHGSASQKRRTVVRLYKKHGRAFHYDIVSA